MWSKNEADVGLVKSANPVKVELRPNVKLPYRPQYPLKPEEEEGVSGTIEGFAGKRVLVETDSVCNTPIFPVLKADKSKYRLVKSSQIYLYSTFNVQNNSKCFT